MNMVEWKKLGDICEIKGRIGFRGYTKDDQVDKGEGAISLSPGNITDGALNFDSCTYITWAKYDESPEIMVSEGDIILGKTASVGKVARIKGLPEKATINPQLVLLKNITINPQYLFYVLSDSPFQKTIKGLAGIGSVPNVSQAKLSQILIPVPNPSEQDRIEKLLDTFTSSIDNLKEQIAQRRKQFEYYRDQLLDLEGKEGVEKRVLKEVCEVINGRAYSQPELLDKGKYRVLRVGNFFSNDSWYYSDLELEDKYYCNKGDLLYAWSASFGPHIWEEEKVIYHYHIWKMNCKEALDTKYMYYWLQSEDMKKQAFSNLHGATMAHLTKVLMESLKVPVPSLSEQQRIVDILDKFEASIQNLEVQLSQREKQYEYYRNKLLTFE